MSFTLDHGEDLRQIVDSAVAMLSANYPVSRLRAGAPDKLSATAEFGTFALALPEGDGGAGFSIVEEALLHVELGRHLVSSRALATSIARGLAQALQQSALASRLATGQIEACIALPADRGSILLPDRSKADLAVCFDKAGLKLLEISGVPGQSVTALGHMGELLRIDGSAAGLVGESQDASMLAFANLLTSAHMLGMSEATRDLAVDYARIREQFGKPIGAFQAIKHHCANMAIDAEVLSAQLDMAAIATRDAREDRDFQIAALRRLAGRTALANARRCIQIHGGIGFSAEADPHHYLKRAHLLSRLSVGFDILGIPAPLAPFISRDAWFA
ncbi:acyl-CoA dehydrogenase family protein [Terrarubrum flagellatum]|uniref:acyl-CoA dehydrogenase family protein n=1 Tax=Terrirubrum flagellatum TaxID=2895980 RepID=UPI00314512C2